MSAAKWHRQRAQDERDISEARAAAYPRHAERYAENAAHHATAADALDALAVPGVTLAIRALANNPSVILSGSGNTMEVTADVRAALATLAKIASEGK